MVNIRDIPGCWFYLPDILSLEKLIENIQVFAEFFSTFRIWPINLIFISFKPIGEEGILLDLNDMMTIR